MRAVIIYYDGNNYLPLLVDTEYPDSSMPHMFGLPDDHAIIALVALPQEDSDPVNVYIEEELFTLQED